MFFTQQSLARHTAATNTRPFWGYVYTQKKLNPAPKHPFSWPELESGQNELPSGQNETPTGQYV